MMRVFFLGFGLEHSACFLVSLSCMFSVEFCSWSIERAVLCSALGVIHGRLNVLFGLKSLAFVLGPLSVVFGFKSRACPALAFLFLVVLA